MCVMICSYRVGATLLHSRLSPPTRRGPAALECPERPFCGPYRRFQGSAGGRVARTAKRRRRAGVAPWRRSGLNPAWRSSHAADMSSRQGFSGCSGQGVEWSSVDHPVIAYVKVHVAECLGGPCAAFASAAWRIEPRSRLARQVRLRCSLCCPLC